MKAQPTVTIAMQRSGTKFFGASLNAGDKYWSYGEIIHPQTRDVESSLFKFLKERQIYLFGSNHLEISRALDLYLEHLASLKPERVPHFDIMYNNLGSLQPIWSFPASVSPVFLLNYFVSRSIGIVHIVRENILDAFISDHVASIRGVFHSTVEKTSLEEVKTTLDIRKMKEFVSGNYLARSVISRQLKAYNHYIEIKYPDFIRGETVVIPSESAARAFDTSDGLFGICNMKKTTNREFVAISNIEEAEFEYETLISQLELEVN